MTNSEHKTEKNTHSIPKVTYAQPKFKHRIEYFFFALFSFILEHIPLKASILLATKLADWVYPLIKKRNNYTLGMIRKTLKVTDERALQILKASYRNFAGNWVCLCRNTRRLAKENWEPVITENFDFLKKAREEKRGVIIATSHIGFWELMPRVFFNEGIPLAIMVAVQHNPLSDKYIIERRSFDGFHDVLHNRLGVRHTLSHLKKGGLLVIVSDIDVGGSGIPVPFLGINASTSKWPAELALRTNAIIVPGLNHFEDGKRIVNLGSPIRPEDFHGDKSEKIYQMSKEMNDAFSNEITKYPEQWFWLQRRWKTQL